MRLGTLLATGLLLPLLSSLPALSRPPDSSSLPRVSANDNRSPAGQLNNGVLDLKMVLREASWYPEEEDGLHRDVYAFAEEGRAPQNSGPLLRVPQGTQIHLSLRNALPLAAKIYGLHQHPGDPKDAIKLAPGETRQLQFSAGEPGTYLYWATTSDSSLADRLTQEELLSGAFIIDARGAKPDDRIFVLGIWQRTKTQASPLDFFAYVNGKSWPQSEHLTFKQGETTHWRILNPSSEEHAMHLHGFYFRVDGVGDGDRYQRYSAEQQRMGVTEHLEVGHVFEMTWTPEREGNWLFHCHMVAHMTSFDQFHPEEAKAPAHMASHELGAGMGGLVLGITVFPDPSAARTVNPASAPRKLQLVISENPEKVPLYKLELNDPNAPAKQEENKAPSLLGPPIILTRGESTEIEVKNLTTNPTAIHWHGIELESYYDGVAGWGGSGQQTTPSIAPGGSFVARMTPPRAGTFIYHTHWHDRKQLQNGLYGALIVLEPGQKYDPELDRVFVFGLGRYAPFGILLLMNGNPQPNMINLQAGTRYRLRFINICLEESDLRVRLMVDDVPVKWKILAKDGMNLPPAQVLVSTAEMGITVGETYDVEFQPEKTGLASLQIWQPSYPGTVTQPLTIAASK
jgi:manganese oxidase